MPESVELVTDSGTPVVSLSKDTVTALDPTWI